MKYIFMEFGHLGKRIMMETVSCAVSSAMKDKFFIDLFNKIKLVGQYKLSEETNDCKKEG